MPDAQPLIEVRLVAGPVAYAPQAPFPAGAGAECVFLGRTRADVHDEYGSLVRLSYEAHEPLAESVLRDLAQEAAARFGCAAVRLHHATGEVPPGEASVLVQAVCGHRDEAFAACRFLIDELKSRVPIWKREVWDLGETWAKGNEVPQPVKGAPA